jgi:hypothetical protein
MTTLASTAGITVPSGWRHRGFLETTSVPMARRLRVTPGDDSPGHDGCPGDERLPVQQVAIAVDHPPEAAQELGDLTQRERDVLAPLREGLA